MVVLWELDTQCDSKGSAVLICLYLQESKLTGAFVFYFLFKLSGTVQLRMSTSIYEFQLISSNVKIFTV